MKTYTIYVPYGAVFGKVVEGRAHEVKFYNDNIMHLTDPEGNLKVIRLGNTQMVVVEDCDEQA